MKAIVIGGNFAGMTAALELKRKLGKAVEVTVIDRSPDFLFIPSLIWVPFGRREIKDISIPRKPVLEKKGVHFLQAEALQVNTSINVLHTTHGDLTYDQLVIATGPKVDFDIAPGIREHANYIGTPPGALKIREALKELKKNPGPIVVGATQSAGCMGAAYEFLFNLDTWLRKQKIRDKVELTWITPEPYLGHFGIDGMTGAKTLVSTFMKMYNIHVRTEVGVQEVQKDKVILSTSEILPSKFTMLMPPFVGVDFIKNSPTLQATPTGYIPTHDTYQHIEHPNIWAAGIAVNVVPPFKTGCVPFGAPKTGYPSDETGKVVAENIVRIAKGKTELKVKPWGKIPAVCIMDAGNKEVIILGDHLFKPRKFAIMIPNLIGDFNKVIFEKYFLWKTRNGLSYLP